MRKGCELCAKPARMYCDSDQARLCWDCDERVHCANFLVAKHTRSLLCHVCQSPTPWKASGPKLGPTVSVCDRCSTSTTSYTINKRANQSSTTRRHPEDEETESSLGEDSDDSDKDHCSDSDDCTSEADDTAAAADEEDGENQVVPWSPSPSAIPSSSAPPLTTSSCSEQGSLSTRDGGEAVSSALKRFRHNPRLDSDEEDGCCSSQRNSKTTAAEEGANGASFRAIKLKMSRRE